MPADRPSLRRNIRRQRRSYRDPITDSEEDLTTNLPTRSLPLRASRALHVAYGEDGSSSQSSSSGSENEHSVHRPRLTQISVPKLHQTRSATYASNGTFRAFKRRKISTPSDVKPVTSQTKSIPPAAPTLSKIPPWQTLPQHVLVRVMRFAAHPFYVGASKDTGSVRWLLDTSRLCTSFHDACIDVLMYNPPTFPSHRAHWLLELLNASARHFGDMHSEQNNASSVTRQRQLSLDYRKKVKSLEIEVKQILVKKAGINLRELLKHTPLLKHLRLYHNHDSLSNRHVWARASHARSNGRWSYGDLFEILDEYNILLSSFEWNGRFMTDDALLLKLLNASTNSRCLSRLQSTTVRNLNLPETNALNGVFAVDDCSLIATGSTTHVTTSTVGTWRNHLLRSFAVSPELEEIVLCDSNIFDDTTITQLPACLKRLEVINCPFVKSEGISRYLQANGGSLTSLILKGNQSLSLEFMSDLRIKVPQLKIFEADLTFYDPTSFSDTEPLFDELFPSGPPTWPTNLQSITICPLRNLGADDAISFYQSLIDAASEMPCLRVLRLRTILNKVSWRDRATLRREWETKLNETFHIEFNSEISAPSDTSTDSQARKSRRLHEQGSIGSSNCGRCHTVLFELSDQRPAQDQFTEGDFLDDLDDADDVEWNEKDDIAPLKYSSRRYAW